MTLPPNWPTMRQAPPTNLPADQRAVRLLEPERDIPQASHCTLTRVTGPLRRIAGPMLADAAIARAEIGREQYGSYVTRGNGRSHAVDALQELADAVAYLAALWDECGAVTNWDGPIDRRPCMLIERAIREACDAAEDIVDALGYIAAEQERTDA